MFVSLKGFNSKGTNSLIAAGDKQVTFEHEGDLFQSAISVDETMHWMNCFQGIIFWGQKFMYLQPNKMTHHKI